MNIDDQKRLAEIRMQCAYWEAMNPEAFDWDSSFLIRLLDAKGCTQGGRNGDNAAKDESQLQTGNAAEHGKTDGQ